MMFRGSVRVPDAAHGGWWRAGSQLDLEIAGNLGVCGSRPNKLGKNNLPENCLAFACFPSTGRFESRRRGRPSSVKAHPRIENNWKNLG